MANSIKKGAIYVDTTGDITLSSGSLKPMLRAIMITPSAADSQVIIKEASSGVTVINVRIENIETRFISFEALDGGGLELNTTFDIETLTNIESVILYGSWNAPVGRAK